MIYITSRDKFYVSFNSVVSSIYGDDTDLTLQALQVVAWMERSGIQVSAVTRRCSAKKGARLNKIPPWKGNQLTLVPFTLELADGDDVVGDVKVSHATDPGSNTGLNSDP